MYPKRQIGYTFLKYVPENAKSGTRRLFHRFWGFLLLLVLLGDLICFFVGGVVTLQS